MCRQKAAPLPELRSVVVDGIDHQGPSADQAGCLHTALERVFDQTGADPLPRPGFVRGKLTEEQTRNRIGRLSGADRARQDRGHNRRGRQTVIADNPPGLMHHENGGKALLLVRQCTGCQPMIERRLAAGELRNVMRDGDRFGSR